MMDYCTCGNPLVAVGKGRARQYCSDRCKQRAYRNKQGTDSLLRLNEMINTVITGDSRELAKRIPDSSIDLVFTDPPYPKEYLPLYGWLAKEAARVLRPGGFLLTYAGNMYKHDVMMDLGQHLTYFYDYVAIHAGMGTMLWPKNTVARSKSILAYVKGQGKPRCRTLGAFTGSGTDKRFHAWGQDEQTSRYYIDCFSYPGQVILDPFVGGGTVPWVCLQLRRKFVGFEIDAKQSEIARARLATIQMPLLDLSAASQETLEFELKEIG